MRWLLIFFSVNLEVQFLCEFGRLFSSELLGTKLITFLKFLMIKTSGISIYSVSGVVLMRWMMALS